MFISKKRKINDAESISVSQNVVICNSCIHKENGLKCKAFDVIPDDILFNKVEHNKVMESQKGDFVYTKIKE